MTTYLRDYPGAITRAEGTSTGSVSGILATDGEAADGHVLDMDGLELPQRPPMLFGHNDWSGERNLGSWEGFSVDGKAKGRKHLRAVGTIDTGGPDGPQKSWREDLAYMVSQGHIRGLSIRWEPKGEPKRRTNLSRDHFAYVNEKDLPFNDPRRYGLYFESSKMVEGSVVTVGSDAGALIGRSRETAGDVASFWARAAHATLQTDGEWVEVVDGDQRVCVPRWAFDKLLSTSNRRLHEALDLVGEAFQARAIENEVTLPEEPESVADPVDEPEPKESSGQLEDFSEQIRGLFTELATETKRDVLEVSRRFTGELDE